LLPNYSTIAHGRIAGPPSHRVATSSSQAITLSSIVSTLNYSPGLALDIASQAGRTPSGSSTRSNPTDRRMRERVTRTRRFSGRP